MILLHAIARADDQQTTASAAEHGLEAYVDHDVVIFHRVVDETPSTETRAVLEFGSMVNALAGAGAILPLRFGSVVEDRQALADLAAERAAAWSALLEELAGRSELIVHLPAPTATPGAGNPCELVTAAGRDTRPAGRTQPGAGRAYLETRAAAAHAERDRLDQLRRLPAVHDVRTLSHNRVSVLVDDPDVARHEVARWAAAQGFGSVEVTGPWPPFSFCEAPA
jgi:hypothetical protein